MTSQRRLALITEYTLQATFPASLPDSLVRYLSLTGQFLHTVFQDHLNLNYLV